MSSATTPKSATRAPGRARLDAESIVAAGIELARSTGAGGISVRDLGARLGADPTAIYRHFRSKESLMQALLDDLITRTVEEVTAPPDEWRDRLRQLARATLDLFSEHPSIGVEATVLTTHGPGELSAVEFMLDAFAHAGLEGDEQVRHYALYASHVLTGSAGIARARAERTAVGESSTRWFDGPFAADPARYPHVARLLPELLQLEDHDLFSLGIENIIQSAERAASHARGADEAPPTLDE